MHRLDQQLLGNPNENLESNLEPDGFDELDEFMDAHGPMEGIEALLSVV